MNLFYGQGTEAALLDNNDRMLASASYDGGPSIFGISGYGKLSMRLSGVGTEAMVDGCRRFVIVVL